MSEKLSPMQKVEQAIKQKLCIARRQGRSPVGGPDYDYPVEIKDGMVTLKCRSTGRVSGEISLDEWAESARRGGLWRLVGMWDFVEADDPATNEIRFAHSSPQSAGRQLYRLKREVEALEAEREKRLSRAEGAS